VQVEPGISTNFDISLEDDFDKEYYLSTPKTSGGNLITGEIGCQEVIPEPANCLPEYADVTYIYNDQPYGHEAELELDKESGILKVNFPLTSKVLIAITLDRFSDDELVCRARQQFIINSFSCSPSSSLSEKG